MTATAHALVGGALATAFPNNPVLGISLALLSHPLLDMIPHWDEGWGWRKKDKLRLFAECSIDLSAGIIATFVLFGAGVNVWYLLACIGAAILWDVLEAPYLILNWHFPPFNYFYKIQSKMQGKAALPWGIVTQVVTVGLVVLVLNKISF
jgi:hypothetical protein